MIKKLGSAVFTFLFIALPADAASVLQVKGNSAILELVDSEFSELQPTAGQKIKISVNGILSDALIKKIVKKKILISVNSDLTGEKNVIIQSDNDSGSANGSKRSSNKISKTNFASANTKKWTLGLNLKYALGGSAKITINNTPFDVTYQGIDFSGIGFYYWGNIGAGVEGEYAMLKGTDRAATYNITQIQLSFLGEYKIKDFSVGGLFTLASNYKSTDSAGNENSLNGMGFGIFGTYTVVPNVRLIFDYRIVDYKLDPATIKTTDMRLGAGYYF